MNGLLFLNKRLANLFIGELIPDCPQETLVDERKPSFRHGPTGFINWLVLRRDIEIQENVMKKKIEELLSDELKKFSNAFIEADIRNLAPDYDEAIKLYEKKMPLRYTYAECFVTWRRDEPNPNVRGDMVIYAERDSSDPAGIHIINIDFSENIAPTCQWVYCRAVKTLTFWPDRFSIRDISPLSECEAIAIWD